MSTKETGLPSEAAAFFLPQKFVIDTHVAYAQQPTEVIASIARIVEQALYPATKFEYMNHFDEWVTCSWAEMLDVITEFVNTRYAISWKRDAARSVAGAEVTVAKNPLTKSRSVTISFAEGTKLGDGMPGRESSLSRNTRFEMTQQKGDQVVTVRLKLRSK